MTEIYIIGVLLGFISMGLSIAIGNLYSRLKDMGKEIADLHLIYAKKEDVRSDFEVIRQSLQRIEDKLDRKQDRAN